MSTKEKRAFGGFLPGELAFLHSLSGSIGKVRLWDTNSMNASSESVVGNFRDAELVLIIAVDVTQEKRRWDDDTVVPAPQAFVLCRSRVGWVEFEHLRRTADRR